MSCINTAALKRQTVKAQVKAGVAVKADENVEIVLPVIVLTVAAPSRAAAAVVVVEKYTTVTMSFLV